MEAFVLEYNNAVALLKYAVIAFGSLTAAYGYLKAKGIKFATIEKVLEYRELQVLVSEIRCRISIKELLAILDYAGGLVKKRSEGKSVTVADLEGLGKMVMDAMSTEEKPGK